MPPDVDQSNADRDELDVVFNDPELEPSFVVDDATIAAELEVWREGRRRRLRWLSIVAVLVAIAFVVHFSARLVNLPDVRFLAESARLELRADVKQLLPAVVHIHADPALPGRSRRGSGFNVAADGLIVTNRHVVEGSRQLYAAFPEHGTYAVDVVSVHPDVDLALLRVRRADIALPVVRMAGADRVVAAAGENGAPSGEAPHLPDEERTVLIIGNPLGLTNVIMQGRLLPAPGTGRAPRLLIEAPIHPGSSGSPVFNLNGEVIGVIYARRQGADGDITGLAIPVRYVHDLIASLS